MTSDLGGGKTPDRVVLRVVGLEDGQQFRDGQQIGDALGQVQQFQAAALPAHRRVGANDLAEPRAVDIRNGGEVEDNFLVTLVDQAVHFVLEKLIALAEGDLASQVQDHDFADGTLLDLHETLQRGFHDAKCARGVENLRATELNIRLRPTAMPRWASARQDPPSPDCKPRWASAGRDRTNVDRPKHGRASDRAGVKQTNRRPTARRLNTAGPGKLAGLEAFLAEDRPPLRRLERHRRLLATGRARGEGFNPLADGTRADRPRCPLALAGFAPLRLVFEVLVGEELLFPCRPDELRTAVHAPEDPVLELHRSLPRRGRSCSCYAAAR